MLILVNGGDINDYIDFMKMILEFEEMGSLTIGVDELLTKTKTLDDTQNER